MAAPAPLLLALAAMAAGPAVHAAEAPPAAASEVEAVTVTGQAAQVQTSIDRRSYSLGKDISASSGSAADALRGVPAVDVDPTGALSLRGDPNVTILVDGKPYAPFDGQSRTDALQQFPADQIERVEVITNPSAALNPNGSGGVINLVLKKSRGAGWTGSTYVTAGSAGLKRAGLNLGYNTRKLSLTGALSGAYANPKTTEAETRLTPDPATGALGEHIVERAHSDLRRNASAKLDASYAATDKDQLTAGVNINDMVLHGRLSSRFEDPPETLDRAGPPQVLDRAGHRQWSDDTTGLTAGWKHSFAGEGHELSIDALQNVEHYRDAVNWTTLPSPAQSSPAQSGPPFSLDIRRLNATHRELKAAYKRPLPGDAKFAAGYELKHDDAFFLLGSGFGADPGPLALDPALTTDFRYRLTVNAAYATYERAFGDLSLQAGLRLEQSRLQLDERRLRQSYDLDDLSAYPTLHLAYKLDDDDKLTASYSRRIQRPDAFSLDPFRVYGDPKTYQQGNPFLKPQQTQSFELGYERRHGKATYLATAFYRLNDHQVSSVIVDEGDGVFLGTFGNLGSSKTAGLELTANGDLTKTLSYTANTSLYWMQIDAANLGIAGGDRSGYGVNARINLNWQATPKDALQLNLVAQGKRLYAQSDALANRSINLGWRRKVTDRVTATLSVQDALNTSRYRERLNMPALKYRSYTAPVTRSISLRLDYRFGGKSKAARDPAFDYESGGGGPQG